MPAPTAPPTRAGTPSLSPHLAPRCPVAAHSAPGQARRPSGDLVERLLGPVDWLRAGLYRLAAPWLRGLYGDRERRVFWLGVFSVSTSVLFTALVPMWLLCLGPVLLGVPHLLADVRYLVVRPGLHRRWTFWLATPALLAAGLGAPPAVGVAACLPAVLTPGPARLRGRALVLLSGGALLFASLRWELPFIVAMVHLHNVLAVGLWLALRRPGPAGPATAALVALVAALLLLGGADGVVAWAGGWQAPATGQRSDDFLAAVAPWASGPWAPRLLLCFAFMQSMHYGVWLRLVPDDARPRAAPRPFAASWRALRADLGLWPLGTFTLAALAVAGWGALDLPGARLGYLRLGAFHGHLEIAALAFLAVEGRRR